MLELPEAVNLARQINQSIAGKRIANVIAAQTPHKFAWYFGDPQNYRQLLIGKTIDEARSYGGLLEIQTGTALILISDGVRLRYLGKNEKQPQKHQLIIEFDDGSALSASVQMYGGLWVFPEGELDDPYYLIAKTKPSPLSSAFDRAYFDLMISSAEVQKMSVKAFLATEQRIPGLGNGVLQDILYNARIHPKRKIHTLSSMEQIALYESIKNTLAEMTFQGGRDTEKDLFDQPGGYQTKLSKNTSGKNCPRCAGTIKKENYLGGSIYHCDGCQRV